jgi:hypothetical protein
MHLPLGKAGFETEQACHRVARSFLVDESCAQHHIAPAFAMHGARFGEGTQAILEVVVRRKPARMQFRIAARQPGNIGAVVRPLIGQRRERHDLGAGR